MMLTFVKASCHCGLNAFNIGFLTEKLPISNDLCHCTSCRHCTGQLAINHVSFEGVPLSLATNEPSDLKHLTPYKTSTSAVRWFCRTCSAHILWEYIGSKTGWCVAVGALERVEGIVKSSYHTWVGDTLDGGIADHIRTVDGLELHRYGAGGRDGRTIPLGWRDLSGTENHDTLLAYCHCKSITLAITRPSSLSTLPSSPYPDLLFPYNTTPPSKITNTEDSKWWLRPADSTTPTHYLAGHCACTSCRLTSGFEIQSWAFIPRTNILVVSPSTPSPVPLQLQAEEMRPGNLKRYASSPGRNREFCATCGASIFWWGDERPELLDVSVGLLDQNQGGVRAESWLEWHKDRVSFVEDALSKTLLEGLEMGLRSK